MSEEIPKYEEERYWNAFNQFEATMYNTYGKTKAIEVLSNNITNYVSHLQQKVEQLENIIKCIKEYADWHVGCCTDDINDYIDDDPKENKYIIDDLKEQREHWRDISKMCDGNFQLYMTNFIFAKE